MLMSTTILRVRVNTEHANRARKVLGNLGLRPADAVGALFAQIAARRGFPFAIEEQGYGYAASEYGLTPAEIDAAAARIDREIAAARRAGTIRRLRPRRHAG